VALELVSAIFWQDECMINVLKLGLLFFSEEACHHSGRVWTVRSTTSIVHKIHV